MSLKIGYKAARGTSSKTGDIICVIVELEIRGQNNEGRTNCYDAKYAKHRCSEAYVRRIWNPATQRTYQRATSAFQSAEMLRQGVSGLEYVCGTVVQPDHYDTDSNKICGGGIHYFKNFCSAMGYARVQCICLLTVKQQKTYGGLYIVADDGGFGALGFLGDQPKLLFQVSKPHALW